MHSNKYIGSISSSLLLPLSLTWDRLLQGGLHSFYPGLPKLVSASWSLVVEPLKTFFRDVEVFSQPTVPPTSETFWTLKENPQALFVLIVLPLPPRNHHRFCDEILRACDYCILDSWDSLCLDRLQVKIKRAATLLKKGEGSCAGIMYHLVDHTLISC